MEPMWTDIVSAVGSVITPLLILGIGAVLGNRVRRLGEQEWRNQELIKARLERYDDIAKPLNEVLCYFTLIGRWKELPPPEVVELKRNLDTSFFVAAPMFSPEAKGCYDPFIGLCFGHFGPWGRDAKLRTKAEKRREAFGDDWNDEWNKMFEISDDTRIDSSQLLRVRDAYNNRIISLMADIGVSGTKISIVTANVGRNAH